MSAAEREDALPFGSHTTLSRLGWTSTAAHRLVAAARFVDRHPVLAASWRSGAVGVERFAELERGSRALTSEQAEDLVLTLAPVLPRLSAAEVAKACAHAVALARPDLADRNDRDAYDDRYLAFTRFAGVVGFQGRLAGVDGKAFQTAIAACAESLRAEGDQLSKAQRNADALMLLASRADLPSYGGVPASVTLTMTMEQAEQAVAALPGRAPDAAAVRGGSKPVWSPGGAGQGHLGHDQALGWSDARFGLCACDITPVVVEPRDRVDRGSLLSRLGLAQLKPLAVGRSARLATTAQRKALAVRDAGCVIPGCDVGPEHIQPHHVTPWSLGGVTDVDALASLCWPHHRQAELGRWELTRSGPPAQGEPAQPWWTAAATPRHRWRTPPQWYPPGPAPDATPATEPGPPDSG